MVEDAPVVMPGHFFYRSIYGKLLNGILMLCKYADRMTPLNPLPKRPTPAHPPVMGFTLIELSIVLVIIALIVGSILVGSDLIESSHIRKQVSQMSEFSQATNAFKLKYNGLPGDITREQAIALGFSYDVNGSINGNGNGNGFINDSYGGNDGSSISNWLYEPVLFFIHLSEVDLIPGKYTFIAPAVVKEFPSLPINPSAGMIATSYQGTLWFYLGISQNDPATNNWLGAISANPGVGYDSVMTPMQAYRIDQKMDDGRPVTGTVLSAGLPSGNIDLWTNSSQCLTTLAENAYNISDSKKWCRLLIQAQ